MDGASIGRELDRIRQEIIKDLFEGSFVSPYCFRDIIGIHGESYSMFLCGFLHHDKAALQ